MGFNPDDLQSTPSNLYSHADDAPSNASEPVSIGGTGGSNNDPFAAQRTADNDPFANQRDTLGDLAASPPAGSPTTGGFPTDRRMSKEWGTFRPRVAAILAPPFWTPAAACRTFEGIELLTRVPFLNRRIESTTIKIPET